MNFEPDLIIYLDAKIETLLKNINTRNREGEHGNITGDYL